MEREPGHAKAGDRQQLLDKGGGKQLADTLVLWIGIGIVGEDFGNRLPVSRLKRIFERPVVFQQRFALPAQDRELRGDRGAVAGKPADAALDQRPQK